ncbi:hypothetical protein L6164_004425 [Bauhinia variegata]|uniref:Uncharacterized protein n=1 Tax=Bauhinia variegata TaxID=167791 RepID=A0ACB9Q3U1_BAUVA|nr:hypothetical protein L6164_004425 [Bauhinia variegata]
MANNVQSSDVEDPLAHYWGLSLFPQTFGVRADHSKLYDPDEDLHAIDKQLRSMALQNPNKFLEQAKSIIDGNPGPFNSQILSDPASDQINDVVTEGDKENPRERRPALGHKRARFSLKPNNNHPTEILKPSLDIDNLKDPEEFFMAFERLEKAKKEIQKQMGGLSFEPNQEDISTNARQRRPGLLGNNQRRSAKYKHRYSLGTSDNNASVPSSQEAFESGGLELVSEDTRESGALHASLEIEPADSSTMEENKLKDILDKLLQSSSEDLEGDGAITRLQESLQIKPIVLGKLSIPDLPDNRVLDFKSLGGNLSKPRKILSNIENYQEKIGEKTPFRPRQGLESPEQQIASPTPPKSPFALLPSLQKRISQSKSSTDPFSDLDSDNLSKRNSSVVDVLSKGVNVVDSGKSSDRLNAVLVEDDIALSMRSSAEDTVRNCADASGNSKENDSTKPDFGINVGLEESNVGMETDVRSSDMSNRVMYDTVGRSNYEANELCEFGDKAEDTREVMVSAPTDNLDLNLSNSPDQPTASVFEANAVDEHAKTSLDGPAECQDITDFPLVIPVQEGAEGSQVSINNKRKVESHPRREQKDESKKKKVESRPQRKRKDIRLSRRQSLAAAGTSWNAGVRRSTRIRSRPLEYWKGERLVYGRIHDSLATVIGVKYMSPGEADGKPTMKVKSYVSDDYKELLKLASQY